MRCLPSPETATFPTSSPHLPSHTHNHREDPPTPSRGLYKLTIPLGCRWLDWGNNLTNWANPSPVSGVWNEKEKQRKINSAVTGSWDM